MTEEVMFCGYCEETKKRREDDDDEAKSSYSRRPDGTRKLSLTLRLNSGAVRRNSISRRAACVRKSKRREIMTLSRTVLEQMYRD